jgi:hypothetical protein
MTEQLQGKCLNNGTTPCSAAAAYMLVRDLTLSVRWNVGAHVNFNQFVEEETRESPGELE